MDPNKCGNDVIDSMALHGRLRAIWDRLYYLRPELRSWRDYITQARRTGALSAAMQRGDTLSAIPDRDKYARLIVSPEEGPQTDEEWDLLAEVCLIAAIGRGRQVEFTRSDYGHVGEVVLDIARGAFVGYNSAGVREIGIVLTQYSWTSADNARPVK